MGSNKVGLCIAYTGTNYGQLLQAFATQQIVRELGYSTEIIKYHSGKKKGIKPSYAAAIVSIKQVSSIFRQKLKKQDTITTDEVHRNNIKLRKMQADLFRKTYLKDVVECNGINELRNKSKEYFAVLVGSDQVWLPDVAVSNFFTLRFAAPGVRRISYATSLGVSSYPNYVKKSAAEFWKKIDYLSVREQQGKDIIQSIAHVPVKVVADPTYLFTKSEWERLIPDARVVQDDYVLCYFLGDSQSTKSYARMFADKVGVRLVSILSDECQSRDDEFADEVIVGESIESFVNLIRHAKYVLTDSFHGLAFSVINEKQVLVFYRNRTDVKESRNSRIDNIVRSWGIEDRLICNPEHMILPTNNIDYVEVSHRVEVLRNQSLEFLESALKS